MTHLVIKTAIEWLIGVGIAELIMWAIRDWRKRRRQEPTTAKSVGLEKTIRKVRRIPTADLGSLLEMATTSNFDAVHGLTRASTPLERMALHTEALAAVRLQEAILEEQLIRNLV